MIYRLLQEFYKSLAVEEVNEIYNRIVIHLKTDNYIENLIKDKLNEYFKDNYLLNIEGFIKFRLNDYISYLVDIISVFAEEYVLEKEYDNLIFLLNKYIMKKESLIDLAEIELTDNSFIIKNSSGYDVTNQLINMCEIIDLFSFEHTYDMLMNLLIECAPKKIIIKCNNGIENNEFLKTLKKIFKKRINIIINDKTDYS